MDFVVLFQLFIHCEVFLAYRTDEWLVISVDSFLVTAPFVRKHETLVTFVTPKLAISIGYVDFHVLRESGWGLTHLAAHRTLI